MLERILFNPDNRLIGSWINDFGTYGGQGNTTATLRNPAADGGELVPAASATPDAALPSHIQAAPLDLSAIDQFLPAPASDVGSGALTAGMPGLVPAAAAAMPASAAQPIGEAVPAPSGSGSLAAFPPIHTVSNAPSESTADGLVSTGTHALDAATQVAPELAHDAGDGLGSVLGTAGAAIAPVAELAATAVEGVTDVASATLTPVVDGVADVASTTVGSVVDGAEAVLAPVTDGVASLTAPLVETATSATDALVTTAVQPVADVVESVAGAATPIVDAAAEPVSAVVESITDTLAEATSGPLADAGSAGLTASTDTLHDLAGTDPAGGVSTLLSLVSVGDVFDMHQVDDADDAATGGDTAMLDALAADMPVVDPLLGDHHDSDNGTLGDGHAIDHSPLAGL